MATDLRGIYAAVVTAYDDQGQPSAGQLGACLEHLARRGCHGVLVAGTTGEGPSLSVAERVALFQAAAEARNGLRLLAGTGAASLEDAVMLTRAAFDAGYEAAVVIPPFFYSQAGEAGLSVFFEEVLRRAVPADGAVLLYHNPVDCAVGVSLALMQRLRDAFPEQVVGVKDSSRSLAHSQSLIDAMPGFQVFVGDDRTLSEGLAVGAAGSITLLANAFPDLAREVYDLYVQGKPLAAAQERLTEAYMQFDGLPRIAAMKLILKAGGIIQSDAVRPPLHPLSEAEEAMLKARFLLDRTIPPVICLSDLIDLGTDDSP